jgi:hypothetical protein
MENTDQKITLKFTFEVNDILHMHKVNLKNQFGKSKVSAYLILGVFIFIVLTYVLIGNSTTTSSDVNDTVINSTSIIQPAIFAIVIICVLCLLPKFFRMEVVKNFKNNKQFQNEFEYNISNEELSGKSIISDFHYDWSYFKKVIETNYAFILYLSDNTVIGLPKRCFSDKDDINKLKNILLSKFSGKRYQMIKVK